MSSDFDILLVEDEPSIAAAVLFILGREGWRVQHCADGESALTLLDRVQPLLIILDLMLPGRSGFEVLSQLRAQSQFNAIRILVLSAQGIAGAPVGADAFLAKPFANTDLREQVRFLLGAPQSRRA